MTSGTDDDATPRLPPRTGEVGVEPGVEAPEEPIEPSATTAVQVPSEWLTPVTRGTGAGVGRGPVPGIGIRTQFFLAAAGLVLAALGVAVAVGSWRANAVAERTIDEALGRVPETFRHYRQTVERQLQTRVEALALEPGTQALVAGTDAVTRWDWTRDTARAQGANTVFLFDRGGALMARSDRPLDGSLGRPFGSVTWVAGVLDDGRPRVAAIREGPVLSLVVSVPIFSGQEDRPVLLGVLAASFAFDETHARALEGLTRGDVAFLVEVSRRDEGPRYEPDAVTPGLRAATGELADRFVSSPEAVERLAAGAVLGPFALTARGDDQVAIAVPVQTSRGETIGAVVVARSRAAETAAFRDIRNSLLAVGALALLVAIPVSFAIGRSVARPVEQLAESAQRIRDGELDVELPAERGGEVGALTRSFREMVEELREKAALERLVTDLRRSATVHAPPTAVEAGARPPGAPVDGTPREGDLLAGRYLLDGCIGRGGMATVFRAFDRELEEEVAVKVLDPSAFELGPEVDRSLRHEIRLARRISHPNVVRTHDLGEAGTTRFLTMEYVPGTTLREVLDRRGTVDLTPGMQIAKQMCRGLDAVHEAGIVHRDLKPPNVMVLPNGVVKLMDFGISVTTGGTPDSEFVAGTPRYMSPEQGAGLVMDARSDLYSVGTILFEMFTGDLPFEAPDVRTLLEARATFDAPRPREFRSELPERLDAIIHACLARDPGARPSSAAALYRLLLDVPL